MSQSLIIATVILTGSLLVGVATVPPQDKIVFLDVGQGDAILIQEGTKQILIDGGPGVSVLEALDKEMPVFDRTIEVIVATHPDRDHLEGLLHVLDRYDVSLVLLPRVPHSSQLQSAWLDMLERAVLEKGTEYRFAWAGQRLDTGGLVISLLGPTHEMAAASMRGKTNNASVITRVDMHGLSFLLTGDAEAAAENQLVRSVRPDLLDVDILKAGHHGSKTSTTPALVQAASPTAVVVSVGAKNQYGHPHPSVLERLAPLSVWRTDEDGSVRFLHGRQGWRIVPEVAKN